MFIAVDHHNAECVGIHAARHGTRFEALEPLRQGVRRHFGSFAQGVARGLSVRHDRGSQYMSGVFQGELAFLGAESSPTFACPRATAAPSASSAPLGEPALGAHLRHRRGEARTALRRQALLAFRDTYNTTWFIQRLGFQTPCAVRQARLSPAALAT